MDSSLVAPPVAGICEGLVAVVAGVHPVSRVDPLMADEVAAAGALLAACGAPVQGEAGVGGALPSHHHLANRQQIQNMCHFCWTNGMFL